METNNNEQANTRPQLTALEIKMAEYNKLRVLIGQSLSATDVEEWEVNEWPKAKELNNNFGKVFKEIDLRGIFDQIGSEVKNRKLKMDTKEPDAQIKYDLREILKKDKNVGVLKIAEYLIDKYKAITTGNRDNTKEVFLYENGVYKVDYGLLQQDILDIIKDVTTSHARSEVMKIVKEKTYKKRDSFVVNKNFINLKNGIYDIEKKILLPHNPEYLFIHQIPVNYDKSVDCPKIKEFLSQILDEEDVIVIQEWIGYCLYRNYFVKKAMIFLGDRDTGKTTLFRVLAKFSGKENLSGVSLQKISSDKFALSNLYQKHVNMYDDLSFKDIKDNGVFKMLTGGGDVTGEKKFGDLFVFTNFAKLLFACNKIPNIKDADDDAYFSRWILIRFEHRADKPDKFLFEKISTEIEMSGLLNFALEGLYRLLENQDFSFKHTPEEMKREMCTSASSLAQFVYTQLEISSDPKAYITKDIMLQEFINFCIEIGLPAGMSKEELGKKLPKYISVGEGDRSLTNPETMRPKQYSCWTGVIFKDSNVKPTPQVPDKKDELIDIFASLEAEKET